MPRRSYNQYCSVARALDLIGDRWTLLIVRELLVGPRRYSDLLAGLPGIGTNHLADRLKRLRAAGVTGRRELPPPAASTVYELTPRGRALESVILGLARWGLGLMGAPEDDLAWRPEWTVVALRGRFDRAAAAGVSETYQFEVEGCAFWARIEDGRLSTDLGTAPDPTITIVADRRPFLQVATGLLSAKEASAMGGYRVKGDPAALERAARIFPPHGPEPRAS